MSKSQYEQMLFDQIVAAGLPEPEREIRFHETRRWRLDIGDRTVKLAVEVEGQVWGRLVKCHRCGAQVLKRTKSGKMVRVREAGGRHTTIGLSLGQLEQGAIQASKLGAMPPTGSDTLTPPPQVLVVIDRPRREPKCAKVVIPGSPRRDTAMAPDPPLPTTNRQRTIKEPPTTTAVDADVLAQLRKFGINGRKATELIVSYTETDELPDLVPRLSEWLIHLDKQPGVTSPIGLAITRVAERVDVPDGKYLRNLADEQRRRSYTEGEWADIIEH